MADYRNILAMLAVSCVTLTAQQPGRSKWVYPDATGRTGREELVHRVHGPLHADTLA